MSRESLVVELGKLLRKEHAQLSRLPDSDAWELVAELAIREVERTTVKMGAVLEMLGTAQRSRTLDALEEWCLHHGEQLRPHQGNSDSFGDGVRWAKDQIVHILRNTK